MKYQAIVNIPAHAVDSFSLVELEDHFADHEVTIRGLNYPAQSAQKKSFKLCLYGTKDNLRTSVKQIYLIASQLVSGIETKPASHIPEGITKKLDEKLYNYCADEYMKHCVLNDESPHPEVSDEFMNR